MHRWAARDFEFQHEEGDVSNKRDEKGKRVYTPYQQAKRARKFRENLARKRNPVRFALALPPGVNLDDVDWNADHFEEIATRLHEMRQRWAKEDAERRQQRLTEVLAAVEADRKAGYLD